MTAHACREHVDESVSWRGTGCQECTRAQREPKDRAAHTDTAKELLDVYGVPIRWLRQ